MTTTDINTETLPDDNKQDEMDYDQYLWELYLNDHIENQVRRIMENCGEETVIPI